MAALAARPRDAEDIRKLVQVLGLHTVDDVLTSVREIFPEEEPPARLRLRLAYPQKGSTPRRSTANRSGLRQCDPRKMYYCETVKNITVSVPDDVYRNARVAAAQRDTSVSALVVAYLEQLSGRIDEFARLEALQHEVQAGIRQFRASGRLSRDEVHERAVR